MNLLEFENVKPTKPGWFWVDIGHMKIPCWFDSDYFLPAGLGDRSSTGLFHDDIKKIGPEIIEPDF